MFVLIELYLIILVFYLAKKDGDAFLLKNNISNPTVLGLIKQSHIDGVLLFLVSLIPIIYIGRKEWWEVIIVGALIRLAEFDVVFNKYANLNLTYIGFTSTDDKFFSKIFGINGAIKKALFFAGLLVVFNILKVILKF